MEKNLWTAVLSRAIRDLAELDLDWMGQERWRIRQAALTWISSPRSGVGSFQWCCDLLELDPGAARERLVSYRPEQLRARLRPCGDRGQPFTEAYDRRDISIRRRREGLRLD